jgi:hypothetical protein
MTKMDQYLYCHEDPETKDILYIGVGQFDRAWCVRGHNRSKEHKQKLEELYEKGFTLENIVKIIEKKLTKEQALELETQFIEKHRPVFNKNKNKSHWDIQRKRAKEICEYAKALSQMGYGYVRIAYLLGADNHSKKGMSIKRMINYV